LLLPCLLEVLHVLVEPVEALVPEPLEPAGPLVNRSQPAGVKAVEASLACLAVPHQSYSPEHPQVFGRPRLGHPQLLGQLGHRPLTRPQQHQDLPALPLGDRVEDVRRSRCSCHGAIIYRYRHTSTREEVAEPPRPQMRLTPTARVDPALRTSTVAQKWLNITLHN